MEQDKTNRAKKQTPYHGYLGTLLRLLEIRAVQIITDFDVVKQAPKGDILILLREGETWTDEQRSYLPDGVRDGDARRKLLEFKYTESFNEDALEQTIGYDIFYGRSYTVSREDVESYILVAMTPDSKTLDSFGYKEAKHPGVYRSQWAIVKRATVIVLNELRDVEHNAYVKLFASRKSAKRAASQRLDDMGILNAFTQLGEYLRGLVRMLFEEDKVDMIYEEYLTTEEIIELGRNEIRREYMSYVNKLNSEERITELGAALDVDILVQVIPPEQRMAGLLDQNVLANFSLDEINAHLQSLITQQPPTSDIDENDNAGDSNELDETE